MNRNVESNPREDQMKTGKVAFDQGNLPARVSLLYPPGFSLNGQNEFLALSPVTAHDLRLDDILAALTPDRRHQKEIRDLFARLPRDPQVISYRQAVLEDLLGNPELAEKF